MQVFVPQFLKALESICEGKKPPVSQVGFFGIGPKKDLDKKLASFKGYEAYYGSQNEFNQSFAFTAAPAFLVKGKESKPVF